MNPLITYYGGKYSIAPWIVSKFPENYRNLHYIEPFAGGASVFWVKEKSKLETLNDLDNNLYNFYYVFQNKYTELKKSLSNIIFFEKEFKRCLDILNKSIKPKDNVEQAYAYFYFLGFSFMGMNSNRKCFRFNNKIIKTSSINNLLENKYLNFDEYFKRLKYVQFFNRDVFNIIKIFNNENVLFYLDPPYLNSDQEYIVNFNEDDFYKTNKCFIKNKR